MGMAPANKARFLSCAFFVACLFTHPQINAACPPDRIDEQVTVQHIHDGDTFTLMDGRRIRLIGINTPELSHDGRPTEPGANEAKFALYQLLQTSDNKIGLRLGVEKQDRYGRTLAHAFLPDGTNLAAALLSEGSAFAITIPPNTWQASCYQQQAEQARDSKRGVWEMSAWRAKSSFNLPKATRGFQRIMGILEKVSHGRTALWLTLSGDFTVRIDKEQLSYFTGMDWNQWLNKRVEISGWVYASNGQPRMNIQHPNAIRRLN